LNTLQTDLRNAYPLLSIQILGINEAGHEVSNASMTHGRSLPWLQDVDGNGNQVSDVWNDLWNVEWRDVVIVDGDNELVEIYNLTSQDLAKPEYYTALREKLVDAAMAEQTPWRNPANPLDVDDDGYVVPRDALWIVNSLRSDDSRKLPPPTGTELSAPYYDCNGDGWIAPIDVLQIVNFIDDVSPAGEGEAPSSQPSSTASPFVLQSPTTAAVAATSPLLRPEMDDRPQEGVAVEVEVPASWGTAPTARTSLPELVQVELPEDLFDLQGDDARVLPSDLWP